MKQQQQCKSTSTYLREQVVADGDLGDARAVPQRARVERVQGVVVQGQGVQQGQGGKGVLEIPNKINMIF